MNPPEPKVEKARKLARLAAGGATEGERAAAREALQRHMQAHGITEADITGSELRKFSLKAVNLRIKKKDRRDEDLIGLACQIVAWVTGFGERAVYQVEYLSEERCRYYAAEAVLSEAEILDVTDAWGHYLPLFLRQRYTLQRELREIAAEMKRRQSAVRDALKIARSAFIQKMKLYSNTKVRKVSPDEMRAVFRSMNAVGGDRWERPAGRIDDGRLLLT